MSLDNFLYPDKKWIPPDSLWLILDFSHLTTKKEFQDVHHILKNVPDNEHERCILSQYYTIIIKKTIPPASPKGIPPPVNKVPFIKNPLKYIKNKD